MNIRETIEDTIRRIREDILSSTFDSRNLFKNYGDAEYEWYMKEEFRKGYIVPKHSVAKILQPKRICEIGVYRGIAAISFMEACPGVEYLGIDVTPEPWVWDSKRIFDSRGYSATILHTDSQRLEAIPNSPYDFIHVDGDHSRAGAKHDVMLAFNALTPDGWMLVDDGCDCKVCAGTFDAMLELPGGNMYWTYIEGTTGSIFIQRRRQ